MTSVPAQAFFGCEVVSIEAGPDHIVLYDTPSPEAPILARIPVGDVVHLPGDASASEDGWIRVRYDTTQEEPWPSGVAGWLLARHLSSDCG